MNSKNNEDIDYSIPGRVFGYCRHSLWKGIPTWEEQQEKVLICAADHKLPQPFLFIDDHTQSNVEWEHRPAGRRLVQALSRRDHVVVYDLDRIIRNALDSARILNLFRRLWITVHAYQGLSRPISMDSVKNDNTIELVMAMTLAAESAKLERKAEREIAKQKQRQIKPKTNPKP